MTLYTKSFEAFDHNFFASAAMSVLAQSCIGGAAAMAVLSNTNSKFLLPQLIIVVFLSIMANTSILAGFKTKYVFNLVISSILVNIFLICINLMA